MKKVLIVTSTLNIGGFDVVATNLQTHLDKNEFECTYYINGETVGPLESMVINSGAKVIHKPNNIRGYYKEYKYLKKVMVEGKYDIVHSHLMFYSGLVMKAAYKAGISKRVPHSHMTNPCMEDRPIAKQIAAKIYSIFMKMWLNKYGTDLVACGPESGDYLYGKRNFKKRGVILNNAIDLDRFKYNKLYRNEIRSELNLGSKIVVGHVGRLNYVKNHKYLVDVFYEVQKINPEAILLIVGDGEQRTNIENKAEELGILDKIIITGMRSDVEKLLSAMDIFVFPSLYEGLPVTLVEAQATKLPCIISDTVTQYVKQNDNIEYMSIKRNPIEWAKKVVNMVKNDRESVCDDELRKNFDINSIAKELEEIYRL